MSAAVLFLAAFFASAVEMVEALTIVLAVGIARSWRSALIGAAAALVALAAVVAALGPALTAIPLDALRLLVGGLLLVFGLQWLRKAILRASGYVALHDEEQIYAEEASRAQAARTGLRHGIDPYAFTLSFKGVLLEGLEVAFIVLTVGSSQQDIPLAAAAAAFAFVLVALIGVFVRAPLSRVPENTLKFGVGIMLVSFGTFWGAEGAGLSWPSGDPALLVLLAFFSCSSLFLVRLLRRQHDRMRPAEANA